MNYFNQRTSEIQRFLLENFEFRYNIVLGKTEYRSKSKDSKIIEFQEITDYEMNSILFLMGSHGINLGTEHLRQLLNSDFVPKYNPFHDYFNSLPEWDRIDYIKQLAGTINATNNELFLWVLQKWLVSTVASLMDDDVINHTIIVLAGKQGKGKSSWIRKLVPEALKRYYYEGIINPMNKDDKFQLAENILIHLDELQSLRTSEIEALKALITSIQVKLRRPYARTQETMPRRASFTGSVNNKEFLTDTTGNRRFLCFETLSIDYLHNISMDMVYAQALYLYKKGFQYWFDESEIAVINESNSDFMTTSVEEDMLLKYLEPCSKEDEESIFSATTEILKTLLIKDNPDPEKPNNIVSRINNPTAITLGKMLVKHGFQKSKVKGMQGYYYKIKNEPSERIEIKEVGYGYYAPKKKQLLIKGR